MATQPDLLNEFAVKQSEIVPAEQPKQLSVIPGLHPLALVDKAIEKGVTPEALDKLMQLALQWEANEARKEFVVALNSFKANPPVIDKNKHVSYKNKDGSYTEYDHATLDHAVEIVSASLSQYGLSFRWKTTQSEGKVRVTCILTHSLGHSEETTLESGPDISGGKNPIQGIGSAVTYLERYTLLAAVGLAAQDQDDDGQGTSQPQMEGLKEQLEYIANAKNPPELKRLGDSARDAANAANDTRAFIEIVIAENKRALDFCRTTEEIRTTAKPHFEKLRTLQDDKGMQRLTADVEAAKRKVLG